MKASAENRGPGRNKRLWTDEEDCLLIEILLDFLKTGNFKAEHGFKAGLLRSVEKALDVKLPHCGLKAKPHIQSRIKTLKVHFNTVRRMLYGQSTGFSWDTERKCVVADKPVWDAYLRVSIFVVCCLFYEYKIDVRCC